MKKNLTRIIGILLCVMLCITGSVCVFAQNDGTLYAEIVEKTISKASSLLLDSSYTHDARFAEGYDIYNVIDVSAHNGDIDWAKVKADGIDGVMIRIGYRGYTEGALFVDDKFEKNYDGAVKAGLDVGVYFYSQAITVKEAQEEAAFVTETLKARKLTLPAAFDCEYAEKNGSYTGRLYKAKLTKSMQTAIALAFCEKIAEAGYSPMLYSNLFMLQEHFFASQIEAKYPVWFARYNNKAEYAGAYDMWQYTSKGSVNGILGNVDMNFRYVKKNNVTPVYLTVNAEKTDVKTGETVQLTASKNDEALAAISGNISAISWSSSNPAVASVNANGLVTAVSVGECEITASLTALPANAPAETFTAGVKITVSENPPVVPPTQDVPEDDPEAETEAPEVGEKGVLEQILDMIVDFIVALINFLSMLTKSSLA